jgi:uncharacterized protein with HEPN domain
MTDHTPDLRLYDIVEATTIARAEMVDTTLEAFERDRRKQLVVERCIEIISEASRHLPDDLKSPPPGHSLAEGSRDPRVSPPMPCWRTLRTAIPPRGS